MSETRRRYLALALGMACTTATLLLACDDSDSNGNVTPDGGAQTPPPPGTTTGTTPTPTPTPPPGPVDAGPDGDGGEESLATVEIGSTGYVQVRESYILAHFYEDTTIVHWDNAPDCVMHVRGPTKPPSPAGLLTIGGEVVGTTGGLPAEVELMADLATFGEHMYGYPDVVWDPAEEHVVSVEMDAVMPTFPAMPTQSLVPRATPVPVTAPTAAANTNVPTTAPFTVTWTAPSGGNVANQRFAVYMALSADDTVAGSKRAVLQCTFPLGAGTGSIPANVLADAKAANKGTTVMGPLLFRAGGFVEYETAGASYVVDVTLDTTSTDWASDQTVTLQ